MRLFKMKHAEVYIGLDEGIFYYLCLFPCPSTPDDPYGKLPLTFKPNMSIYKQVKSTPVYKKIPTGYKYK